MRLLPLAMPLAVITNLEGGARPDIVVTHLCGDPAAGGTRRLLHPSAGAP